MLIIRGYKARTEKEAAMALVRCERCGVKPPGVGNYTRNYVRSVPPVHHPRSGIICGRSLCDRAGLIWLEPHEVKAHRAGQRIFKLNTDTTKVRAA